MLSSAVRQKVPCSVWFLAGRRAKLDLMAEPNHPIPNLSALRAQLSEGLALDLVDVLTDAGTMAEISEILSNRLRARVSEIEEKFRATPEVD